MPDRAVTQPDVSPPAPERRNYRAFISYSHADTRWANWLLRRLESYRVPQRFHGRRAPIGEVGARIAPVFRDRDELPTTSDLGEAVRSALGKAATLIVICSPSSAKSRWVGEEIKAFKRIHGDDHVFAFIVAGEPKVAGAADDCFSHALRFEVGPDGELSEAPAEVVAADARPHGDGPRTAFIRLVAGLLGVGFDDLRRRELQRRNRRLTYIAAASVVGMAITLGLAIAAWHARNEAVLARNDAQRRQDQAEDVLSFMLGEFREDLKKVGQLPLLDKVGNKAMTYFDTLDTRDLTDTALARHAKALTQIGEVRIEQKDVRYADAGRAFFTAYQRAAELASRHPKNGDMLFERAQAEYWIGFVHWKRREFVPARTWLTRYRNSALTLAGLEGPMLRARREVISGHHNLAVLELDLGRVQEAREGFLAELAMHRELLAGNPADRQIAFRIADTLSWLGSTAEQAGEFREAVERFAGQVAQLEALVNADPQTAQWRYKLADAKAGYAILLAMTGQLSRAQEQLTEARGLLEKLLTSDPGNRRWQLLGWTIRLQTVAYSPEQWNERSALEAVETARREIENLMAAEPKDRNFSKRAGFAWRLEAMVRFRGGLTDAAAAADRAIELSEASIQGGGSSELIGACAQSHIMAGGIARTTDEQTAQQHYRRALEIVTPVAKQSRDWRLLDPLARALSLLGREADSRAIRERLETLGYRPIDPWPAFPSEIQTTKNK